MTRAEIVEIIVEEVSELAFLLDESPVEINETIRPIGEVGGFDSLVGVSATVGCLGKLGMDKEFEHENLFVGKSTNGKLFARSIQEIADFIISNSDICQAGEK